MKDSSEHLVLFEMGCADLKLVERSLDDQEINRQLLLFHLQQAVEKFLKSLLSFGKIKYPKIHDIEAIIELCEGNKIELPEYVEDFVLLTPYAIGFRYALIIEEISDLPYHYAKVSQMKAFVKDKLFSAGNSE